MHAQPLTVRSHQKPTKISLFCIVKYLNCAPILCYQ